MISALISFSALSRAVVGGTLFSKNGSKSIPGVSVLSVEPWLVEHRCQVSVCHHPPLFQCSQSSRGWWNPDLARDKPGICKGFSALSRAVVGGTKSGCGHQQCRCCFSALSRAVVGGTRRFVPGWEHRQQFQCSQSSRGWWNTLWQVLRTITGEVSVLSVEPWLVELWAPV